MSEIKQIITPLFIERLNNISILLKKMSKIDKKLKSMGLNIKVSVDSFKFDING